MKNAIQYKNETLAPNSKAYEMFKEWKKETDPKLNKSARAKLDAHLKQVNETYLQVTVGKSE